MTLIQTLRTPRIAGMAIFDWATSLLAATAIGFWFLRLTGYFQWILFLIGWIAFGVFVHWVTGTKTMFGFYLGLNDNPNTTTSTS